MSFDSVFSPCPKCRTGLDPHPITPIRSWEGEEWEVFICPKNCKSEVWVNPFKGIKEQQSSKPPWWSLRKR